MFSNVDPDQVKQQSERMKNMSDDDIKRQIDAAKAFMPGMPNITPEMMRFASQSIGQMSPDQIQSTINKSKSMSSASPSSNNTTNAPAPKTSASQNTSNNQSSSGPAKTVSHPDLDKANAIKEEANALVKNGQQEKACEKYFEAINTIRFSDKIKNTQEGKAAEMACRLNIALCKQTLGDYAAVVDQCERVLTWEQNNWKAQFRLSQALYALIESKKQDKSGSEMKTVVEYAKKAHENNPADAKIKDFYSKVKEEYKPAQSEEPAEPKNTSPIQEEEQKSSQSYAYTPASQASSSSQYTTQGRTITQEELNKMPPLQKAKLLKENSERIKSMDDGQLKTMIEMMKGNKEYMRNMYKAQGMDLSDEQLESLSQMMSPEMIKNASEMLSKNPDLINQMKPGVQAGLQQQQQQQQTQNTTAQEQNQSQFENAEEEKHVAPPAQQQPQPNPFAGMAGAGGVPNMAEMMNNPMVQQMLNNPDFMKQAAAMMGGGGAGFDPAGMQSMMQNPSLKGMLQNPEFLQNTVKMLKGNKAMLDMMQQQNPGMNVNLLIKALEGVSMVAGAYKTVRTAWSNVFVRLAVFGLIVLVISYFFG